MQTICTLCTTVLPSCAACKDEYTCLNCISDTNYALSISVSGSVQCVLCSNIVGCIGCKYSNCYLCAIGYVLMDTNNLTIKSCKK
jgi:hypothetical protein